MARRKKVYNRPETRDPRYDSPVVGKLISKVMRDGKRSLSERIVYSAIDKANDGTDTIDPLEVVTRALENAKPRVEVKSRRVGGATYQVPLEVDAGRSESLAMRWLVNFARSKKGTPMHVALANEIKDAPLRCPGALKTGIAVCTVTGPSLHLQTEKNNTSTPDLWRHMTPPHQRFPPGFPRDTSRAEREFVRAQ